MTSQVIVERRSFPHSDGIRDPGGLTVTMTDVDATPTVPRTATTLGQAGRAAQHLRDLVRVDAAAAAISGLALLAAAGPLTDLTGLTTAGPARVVGAFLLLLALDLAWLGAASDQARQRWVPISAAGDILWSVASFAVAAGADLTGPGRALIVMQGLLVLGVGEAKLVLHRRARSEV